METEAADQASIDALAAIASPPPTFPAAELRALLYEQYGLEGEIRPLVSERDQNVALTSASGKRFVLKIANAAEDPLVTDFQVRALRHLEAVGCPVATPRIVPALDGSVSTQIGAAEAPHVCRVVTYLAGSPITGRSIDERTAANIGSVLADLDTALADFSHPGDSQLLLWDMQRTLQVRPLLHFVGDTALRDMIGTCLDDFEADVVPFMQATDRQVIHGDLNPGNVLLGRDGTTVAGIIDFGDMLRAPVAADIAIAASYLRAGGSDPLALVVAFIAGYASVSAISDESLAVLHGMIRARLATSITLLQWRLHTRGSGDAYSEASAASEDDAAGFLAALDSIGKKRFLERLRQVLER